MDPETIAYVIAVMVLMFSALNTIVLHDLFKRMKANSEDLNAFKKIKWRWVLFYFTDVLVLVGIFFLTLLIIRDALISIYISLIITALYLFNFIERKGRKHAPLKKEDPIKILRSASHVRYRTDDEKNLNGINSTSVDETRSLIINRIKAFPACLTNLLIFSEIQDPGNDIGLMINEKRFKQIGTVSYGKTISVRIPINSTELVIATSILVICKII